MGIFSGKLNVGKIASDVLEKIDDSSLTMQEKAIGTIEFMERLGITPSSKTRRQVTWLQLSFIMLWMICTGVAYYFNPDYAKFLQQLLIDFSTNGIILTINAFFYGGYYLSKNVSPALKQRMEKKKQEREMKQKEFDHKMLQKEVVLERKRNRIRKRN